MTLDDSLASLQRTWQGQEPMAAPTLDEVRRRSQRLTRTIGWRNLREYAAGAVVIPVIAVEIARGGFDGLIDLGQVLLLAGCVYVLYRLHQQGRARAVPAALGLTDALTFHRAELVRQRDLLMSVWRWYLLPFQPGFFVTLLGRAVEYPALRQRAVWTWLGAVGLTLLAAWLNRRGAARVQHHIEALEALAEGRVSPTTAERRFPPIDVVTMWVLGAIVSAMVPLMLWHGLGFGAPRVWGGPVPWGERVWLAVAALAGVAIQAAWWFLRKRRDRL